jgi:hypothetical protein
MLSGRNLPTCRKKVLPPSRNRRISQATSQKRAGSWMSADQLPTDERCVGFKVLTVVLVSGTSRCVFWQKFSLAGCFLSLLLNPDDGGCAFLRNFCQTIERHIPADSALYFPYRRCQLHVSSTAWCFAVAECIQREIPYHQWAVHLLA